jgi:hypothetical protein
VVQIADGGTERFGGDEMSATMPVTAVIGDVFDMHGDFGSGWWIVMLVGRILFSGLVVGAICVARELSRRRVGDAAVEHPTAG